MSIPMSQRQQGVLCGKRHRAGSYAEQECQSRLANRKKKQKYNSGEMMEEFNNGTLEDKEEAKKIAKREFNKVVGKIYSMARREMMGGSATDIVVGNVYMTYSAGLDNSDDGEKQYQEMKKSLKELWDVGDLGSYEYEYADEVLDEAYDLGLDHSGKIT